MAGLVALSLAIQPVSARLYDNFNNANNWTLAANGGTSVIGSSVLTLTSPSGKLSNPTATLKSSQALSNSRQSILVRSHTGVANSTVFFLWAIDESTGNYLELKLDDINPTTVVAGYWNSGGTSYHYIGSASYAPGKDGLYMAFREASGTTYWEISTDASSWTEVASLADPVSTASVTFEVEHKAYVDTSVSTESVVDCFNYKATGVGYHSLEDKTTSGGEGWELYTEGFSNGQRVCCNSGCTSCVMTVNGVDSSQHFTDTSIPAPYTNQDGYDFQITSTAEPTTHWYYNAYRYQDLPYVDADTWTYHLYFKYAYPQYITQGLEFPINKYTGSQRLQGAVAWYPLRDGTDNGEWSVWTGTTWHATGNYQKLQTNWWYEVTFTVGLHDGYVYYNGFSAGDVGSLSNFSWSTNYPGTSSSFAANIVPAMQIDDNVQDTTTANTRKDCYMAEWHIDWTDERLP
ncbi:MAG TPA: hypothetical protein VFB72_12950 [Verrucomicrobiae bacterium]|nr:hypothetical protein [Verrucomicrobiae bacterium]